MSEETPQQFIPKKDKGAGTFQELYLEGIELLQKLSSNTWTDFNEHDPGVTILENLSYTLSDLLNRSDLPINDILTEGKGAALHSGDNAFFVPSAILTTNPVTNDDTRKAIIDGEPKVKNAWLESLSTKKTSSQKGIKGLYRIFVELHKYDATAVDFNVESEKIKEKVADIFLKNRNLCDDLYEVVILKRFNVKFTCQLMVKPELNGERVFADILHAITEYLSPGVRFSSLFDLHEQNVSVNDIFSGPKLANGFIKNEELNARLTAINRNKILRIISQIDGVVGIEKLELSYQKEDSEESAFEVHPQNQLTVDIPKEYAPSLVFPTHEADVVLKNGIISFNPNLKQVNKLLSYKQAVSKGVYNSVTTSLNEMGIPKGENRNAKAYYSMLEQFPEVYGIGQYGLPPNLPVERYAQANQLKTYLLPFDQLMANHLAQLTNIYNLYSVEEGPKQSYYSQLLDETRVEFFDLDISDENEDLSKDEITENKQLAWLKQINELNEESRDAALQRLNHAANELLARFGEKFPSYALRKINEEAFGKSVTHDSFGEKLLRWKRKFLKQYHHLSYNRAKAALSRSELTADENFIINDPEGTLVAGIVKKIGLLLGIENFFIHPLATTVLNSGFKIYTKNDGFAVLGERLNVNDPDSSFSSISIDDVVIIDDKVENLKDDLYYLGSAGTLIEDTIRQGAKLENYFIRSTDGTRNKDFYVLLNKENNKKNVVHIASSKQAALDTIKNAVKFFTDLGNQTEGIYLVEHLPLLPPFQSKQFGFSFQVQLDANTDFEFKDFELYNTKQRNLQVESLLEGIAGLNQSSNEGYQLQVIRVEGSYSIQIFNEEARQRAISASMYPSLEQAQDELEKVAKALSETTSESLEKTLEYFVYYGEGRRMSERFFSFQMSFILPAWPPRFQNINFRTKFQSLVREHAPAHIASHIFWLNIKQMLDFERTYYPWLTNELHNIHSSDQKELDFKMIEKIQTFKTHKPLETIR